MKWTRQQETELRQLCFEGKANDDLAAHFGVPASEIHAKRSKLGITIPKVKAAKGETNPTITEVRGDEKATGKAFIRLLAQLLHRADRRITGLTQADNGNAVLVAYAGGAGIRVNVSGDSPMAIIHDVSRACIF